MKIPIRNLYWLLLYAWDALEEAESVGASAQGFSKLQDLYAAVLSAGTERLLRRGIDRDYVAHEATLAGIRGRIDMQATMSRNLRAQAKTHCRYDEFSDDILANQILKFCLYRLLRSDLDPALQTRVRRLYRRLGQISDTSISASDFGRVRYHRNNNEYRLLLHICWLIHRDAIVHESTGRVTFRDFRRNRRAMAVLFERFVRGYFQRHGHEVRARKRQYPWKGVSGSQEAMDHLPGMEADIVLSSTDRRLVVDTKFYKKPLTTHHGKRIVRPNHVRQIFAYMKNLPSDESPIDGMLLYAAVGEDFDFAYDFPDHTVWVRSLNLDQDWEGLRNELDNVLMLPLIGGPISNTPPTLASQA